MKLIIKQYLASLKERNELDAILPDLLSELGLNVFSRPGRGTRQDGVDVAAVGSLNGGEEKVYLFSIKAGDLTRNSWDGDALQSLRPSLNEILDSYIPNRLPDEHRTKYIVVCLCFGGDIQEQVRPQVEGYIKQNKKEGISFEEWNGDKLASLILSSFLREDLLPDNARSQLRKSLALIDEPESSYRHFAVLLKMLTSVETSRDKERLTLVRQITICLWILFSWTREAGNLEAAYLSSEISLLYAWNIAKPYQNQKTKVATEIQMAFQSVLTAYLQISSEFVNTRILPSVSKRHALSTAIHSSCSLDVNLKLFEVLGRLALEGVWAYWIMTRTEEEEQIHNALREKVVTITESIKQLIINNPALFLPIKDDQAIDISIAVLLLAVDGNNHDDIAQWLSEMVNRADFSYKIGGKYPCNLRTYSDLLDHPQRIEDEYRREVTGGSILFPIIALSAALLDEDNLYSEVQTIRENHLAHCNFQFWYPDESSEEHFYINSDAHGGTLSNVCIDRSMKEYLEQVFGECSHSPQFNSLSAVESGLWPLVIVACRHYRLPLPLHLWKGFYVTEQITKTG
ncbi:hypothetical protein ACQ4M4_10940 [Leptolyngbya sp. AN02str]|uniref:hypothetical protein n=1 Tax=Leptolyngbya sp. AN02str TaxID=3423363 RepID=UPI003D3172B1